RYAGPRGRGRTTRRAVPPDAGGRIPSALLFVGQVSNLSVARTGWKPVLRTDNSSPARASGRGGAPGAAGFQPGRAGPGGRRLLDEVQRPALDLLVDPAHVLA